MRGPRIRWRRELLQASILAMDATWLAPWLAFLGGADRDPAHRLPLVGVLALLYGALVVTRLLVASPLALGVQQAAEGLLAAAGGLALVGLRLYGEHSFLGLGWLAHWLGDVARLERHGITGLLFVGAALYAVGRSISLVQSRLETATVGFYLRFGIVAWFWLQVLGLFGATEAPVAWLFLYFFLALLAVGLSRVEEVHLGRGAVRSPFTAAWLLIMAGAAAGATGLGLLATVVLSREVVAKGWRALAPLWKVLGWVADLLLRVVFLVLAPLLEALRTSLAGRGSQAIPVPRPVGAAPSGPLRQPTGLPFPIGAAIWALVGLGLVAVVLLMVTVLRRREESGRLEGEGEAAWSRAQAEGGPGLRAGLQRLRSGLAAILGAAPAPRYSLASVRDIYASLLRLAAGQGVRRDEAETPYEYEHRLDGTWPQVEGDIASITAAYVWAHYGEREFSADEVEALRARWQRLREQVDGNGSAP